MKTTWFCGSFDMCSTCNYVEGMPKMIQLRHVPDQVHRKLKSRAALKGLSLSDYLVREITEIAEQPTLEETLERIRRRRRVKLPEPAAKTIRALRDSR
jgi:antitoxin FitA